MSISRHFLGLVLCTLMSVSGLAQAQDHSHQHAVDGQQAATHSHADHAPGPAQSSDGGDHAAMNHEEMNREEMNHEEMNREEMNREEMNREEMNREEMNQEEMNHEAMNHEAMNHEEMNHEEMNHDEMNHEEMNHEAMHHEEMNHEEMNHEEMNHEAMDHSQMNHVNSVSIIPRDPHAYSGGYERSSGPYSLPEQRQVRLADETTFSGLWMDRFEYVDHEAGEGAELEGYGWFGNSYRQFLIQAQLETVEGEIEEGEVDLLYSRAFSPFWDYRVGLHRSFGENVDRDWAVIGVKGLAPYWFEIDARLHLGENGRTAMDIEAEYELLLTQRLVLQPRIDISAFGKTDPELGRGSGLSTIKTGARLRYEFDRQFAPYIGVERVKRFGETADLLPAGSSQSETHWVLGLRYWF